VLYTNFGDELNAWLWPRILPGIWDDDPEVAFIGIGSLLGNPKHYDAGLRHKIIFGTGAAFADAARREPLDRRWTVYCVRGPLTVRAYDLAPELGVTDPAVLVARCVQRREQPEHPLGFVPHITEAVNWGGILRQACERAGVLYIDPREPVDDVLAKIGSVAIIAAEAMHGAIVADALRVPWVPVYTTYRPHTFKWTDWCRSLELEYRPLRAPNLAYFAARLKVPRLKPLADLAARGLAVMLDRLGHPARVLLSADTVHADRLDRLDSCCSRLLADLRGGRFA
jgi:succinoglycan biosynthesis protein ExoV